MQLSSNSIVKDIAFNTVCFSAALASIGQTQGQEADTGKTTTPIVLKNNSSLDNLTIANHNQLAKASFTRALSMLIPIEDTVKKEGVVGQETKLWNWTEKAPHHNAVVEIYTPNGSGTGILISADKSKPIQDGFQGLALTAYHVVQSDLTNSKIKVSYTNGRSCKDCKVLHYDADRDIALVWVWAPSDIVPATVAIQSIKSGDTLEFAGLGGGSSLKNIRHFSGIASHPSSLEKIFADTPLLPGDSGGPVFNAYGEVVGIISGGWFWWDGGVKASFGKVHATWPARASNLDPIRILMAKHKLSGR